MSYMEEDGEDDLRHMFTDNESEDEYHDSDDWQIDDALKPKRRKRGEAQDEPLEPEVQELFGRAQHAFSLGNHQAAIQMVEEVIAANPNARIAYNLLSAIYDDLHDPQKALLAKTMAAHLNKKSKEDWVEVADRSYELGLLNQAAVFYQNASRIARDDWTLLLIRAQVNMEMNQPGRSLNLLFRIRDKFFPSLSEDAKTKVMLDIGRALKQLGKIGEATEQYMSLYRSSLNPESHGEPDVLLNWQNLNVLGELLFEQELYKKAVDTLKTGSRWILGRHDETFWEKADDDSEFDERRFNLEVDGSSEKLALGPPAKYELPIDIRVWLLVCRVKQTKEEPTALEDALIHLRFLKACTPVADFSDLYARAGNALFQAKLFKEALDIYMSLTDIEYETQEEYLNMTINVAKCYMELGDVKKAENLYKHVISKDDRNVEALVALGEIYQASSRPAAAKLMVEQVMRIRHEEAQARVEEQSGDIDSRSSTPLISTPVRPAQPGTRLSAAERAELERTAQQRADANYELLERFRTGLENGNIVAALEWIRSASVLIQMFVSNRKFFPSDRNKIFVHGIRKESIEDRVAALSDVAREDAVAGDDDDDEGRLPSQTPAAIIRGFKFRGRPFEFWFTLFMRCALAMAKYKSAESAYELVKTAGASNIFHVDIQRDQTMNLVLLSCAWQVGDTSTISDTLRHMYMDRQFHNDIIRLYGALLSSGKRAMKSFGSSNNQKFFLRQIKALDSVAQNRRISGAARVDSDSRADIQKENPLLFVLYSHIMLMGPSYVPALTYLMRALEHLPQDPVVLLTLGIVYVQRAIQRVTTNRHLQILQGLSYMQDYRATRQKNDAQKQEADYNMGRFFHGLGLFTLAIPFYEHVLGYDIDEEYDLSREAAYNLHLISAISGNMHYSHELVDKYLTI